MPFHMLQSVVNNKISAGYHSDHSIVQLTIDLTTEPKGRGFWKLNCSVLSDQDYVHTIDTIIDNTVLENPDTDDQLLWEIIKCNVRRDSISFCHRKN